MLKAHRNHRLYWTHIAHRLSGIALALFLPFHFLLLGQALDGAQSLDQALALVDHPAFKLAEWGLVVFLGLHLFFGLRLLALEFTDWPGRDPARAGWIWPGVIAAFVIGGVFAFGGLS